LDGHGRGGRLPRSPLPHPLPHHPHRQAPLLPPADHGRAVDEGELARIRILAHARSSVSGLTTTTESPLPLWERGSVSGLAAAGANESAGRARRVRSCRAAARVPSPCPSPTRGEGTLYGGLASAP